MSAARSYCHPDVKLTTDRLPDRSASLAGATPPTGTKEPGAGDNETADAAEAPAPTSLVDRVDLSGLSVAGISRRHVGWLAAGLLAAWIVIVFAHQVGDAAAAANRAVQLAEDNAALAAEVNSLQGELDQIVRPTYVAIEARGVGLGSPREIAFSLDRAVPAPVDGAPGSASARLGASATSQTPLESWLSMLFGPAG
jgi:hypothetical protein